MRGHQAAIDQKISYSRKYLIASHLWNAHIFRWKVINWIGKISIWYSWSLYNIRSFVGLLCSDFVGTYWMFLFVPIMVYIGYIPLLVCVCKDRWMHAQRFQWWQCSCVSTRSICGNPTYNNPQDGKRFSGFSQHIITA